MPPIAQHKETEDYYVVLGSSVLKDEGFKNGFFGLVLDEERGDFYHALTVCDSNGEILTFNADEMRIVLVDDLCPECALMGLD